MTLSPPEIYCKPGRRVKLTARVLPSVRNLAPAAMMPTARLLPATLTAPTLSESYWLSLPIVLGFAEIVSNFRPAHRILEHAVELVASLSVETVALLLVRSLQMPMMPFEVRVLALTVDERRWRMDATSRLTEWLAVELFWGYCLVISPEEYHDCLDSWALFAVFVCSFIKCKFPCWERTLWGEV